MSRNPALAPTEAEDVFAAILRAERTGHFGVPNLLRVLECTYRHAAPSAAMCDTLRAWRRQFVTTYHQDPVRLIARLDRLIERGPPITRTVRPPRSTEAAITLLRDVARDAWPTMNDGRPVALPAPISNDLFDRIEPDRAWNAMVALSQDLTDTYGTRDDHIGRYVASRVGFLPFQALAPEFCASLRRIFQIVAREPDESLCTLFAARSHRPLDPKYFHAQKLVEALWLDHADKPSLYSAYRQRFESDNADGDCPTWGDAFEPLEEEADRGGFEFALPGDAWSDAANAWLTSLAPGQRTPWKALIDHCAWTDWANPPKAWLAKARSLHDAAAQSLDRLCGWLRLLGERGSREPNALMGWPPDARIIRFGNGRLLRGLVWAASHREDASFAAALARAAVACDMRVLRLGPMNVIVRNAAINVLGMLPPRCAGPHLATVDALVKYKSARTRSSRVVASAAAATALSVDEFCETMVPDHGPVALGNALRPLHGQTYRVALASPCRPVIERAGPDASWAAEPNPPAPLAVECDEIESLLRARCARLERLLMLEREWTASQWRDRYGDHPLLAGLGRSLIWRIGPHSAMWDGRAWIDASGPTLTPPPDAPVRLWHPAQDDASETARWRESVEARRIRQPFKQAHREVYRLTEAERETDLYSNRFAAHILRGRQVNALLRERRWEGRAWDPFDEGVSPARLPIPEHDLLATFGLESISDGVGPGEDLLSSDRVWFTRLSDGRQVALDEVPALVFSEVMRDVDLFVGVSSVGQDPNWFDGGPGNHFRDYWWNAAFAPLSESGASRRDLLSRLLPRLTIASRCTLDERYLIVRGDLRTYRIHLGSTNVLMDPGSEFLCIVPKSPKGADQADSRTPARDVFLPFEGDRTLSLILSKAFMLAADGAINDRSILSQIRGRPPFGRTGAP